MHHDRTRVLYCESNTDGTVGGSHYCLLHLVENLDRSDFAPTVVFYQEHALVARFRAAAETLILTRRNPLQWGISSNGTPRSSVIQMAVIVRRAANFLKAARTVLDNVMFLRRRGIGLVHLNNSITGHHEWMVAAAMAGVPCVVHERGLSESYSRLDRTLARRLALIIPMSRWIRDHMVSRGVSPDNIRIMYDGLDPDSRVATRRALDLRQQWGVHDDQRVVGIVGNVREWKGQETVVRAMIEVARTYPNVVCFIVGASTAADGPFEARLKRLIAEAGIGENVRFTGYQNDVPSFVNMMEFVIHASVQPEPFGMVVLEAMAQRKAVIGSRAGGVIEMLLEGETGYSFPPGDWRVLASLMVKLLSDANHAKQLGENGYHRLINSFTMKRYMSDLHEAYRAILAGRPLPSELGIAHSAGSSSPV